MRLPRAGLGPRDLDVEVIGEDGGCEEWEGEEEVERRERCRGLAWEPHERQADMVTEANANKKVAECDAMLACERAADDRLNVSGRKFGKGVVVI